jgi:hypothetical protein
MRKTNFDQSSTGTDIELSVFYDTDLSRHEWEENFIEIARIGRNDGYFWYTSYRQYEAPGSVLDCIDLSDVTWKEARAWCVEHLTDSYTSVRDVIEMRREYRHASKPEAWLELLSDTIADLDLVEYLRDGLDRPIGTERYNTTSITGHCQGDYATVLYDPSIWAGGFDPHQYFENLFYNSPVYISLCIDGRDIECYDWLDDPYEWDRDAVAEQVRKLDDVSEDAKTWIIEQLPEYPDY